MVEVCTWEPDASSGKPLFCFREKRVPFTHHCIHRGKYERFSPEFPAHVSQFPTLEIGVPDAVGKWLARVSRKASGTRGPREVELLPTVCSERGRRG